MKDFLDTSEREDLKSRHRQERDGRSRDRIKAVLLSNDGWTYRQIAHALLLDEQTVALHIKEYIEKKKLSLESGGSKSKLDAQQTAEFVAHLTQNTYQKVQEICAFVKATYDISYTVAGMTYWLHHNGFSYKKPKGTPAKADVAKQEVFINFYNELLTITPEDEPILFADGVHPTMATKVTYGWIKKGEDKLILTTGSKTRLNILGALNLETMTADIAHYQVLNSDTIELFFKMLREKNPHKRTIHLIVDQASYNTSAKSRQAAEKYNIKLHYLPPYSPNLNPIERLWKVMNEYARNNQFFASSQAFKDAVLGFFESTWPKIRWSMRDRINDNFQRLAI